MAKQEKKVDEIEESELRQTLFESKKTIFMAGFFSMFINLLIMKLTFIKELE